MLVKDSDIDYIVRYIKEDNCFRKANNNCSNSYFLSKIENAVHEIAANNSIEYLLALPDAVFNALPWYERGGTYENFEEFVERELENSSEKQQTAAKEGASGPQPGQTTDTKPEPKDGQGEGRETATKPHKYDIPSGLIDRTYTLLSEFLKGVGPKLWREAMLSADFGEVLSRLSNKKDRSPIQSLAYFISCFSYRLGTDGKDWYQHSAESIGKTPHYCSGRIFKVKTEFRTSCDRLKDLSDELTI